MATGELGATEDWREDDVGSSRQRLYRTPLSPC